MGCTRRMLVGVVAVLAMSATAWAGALATDPDAYTDTTDTWQGTIDLLQGELAGTVDWAVFHEDDWDYDGYTVQPDPNFPTLDVFVYAYQVFSTGPDQLTRLFVSMLRCSHLWYSSEVSNTM